MGRWGLRVIMEGLPWMGIMYIRGIGFRGSVLRGYVRDSWKETQGILCLTRYLTLKFRCEKVVRKNISKSKQSHETRVLKRLRNWRIGRTAIEHSGRRAVMTTLSAFVDVVAWHRF